MPGVGMTDGESPERRWSVLNLLGRSIREMGSGHRQDTLNAHFSDYNMQKLFGLRMYYFGHSPRSLLTCIIYSQVPRKKTSKCYKVLCREVRRV